MEKLESEIMEFDSRSELHKRLVRSLLSELSPTEINSLRYRLFAPHYDQHMLEHEKAMRFLIRQLMGIESALGGGPLLKDRMLEASCGTGTVIQLLCQEYGWERAAGFDITANDISEEMKEIAKRKLAGYPASVEFTSENLNSLEFPRESFGTLILSQTLHLITDEDVLAQERARNYMHISGKRHLGAKTKVLQGALNLIEPGGTIIIIDEWPALLTDKAGPLGAGFAYLFNDGLRPIDDKALRYAVMGRMPRVRFVADTNVPIDADHTMHLMVFRKEGWSGNQELQIPVHAHVNERMEAARKVLGALCAMDPQFLESNRPQNGEEPWINYIPLAWGDMLFIDESNIGSIGTGHGCIVLDRCLHEIDRDARRDLLEKAAGSIAVGGSLIIAAEWEYPAGSTSPIKRGSFNHLMDELSKNLIFQGEVRLPISEGHPAGMYGLHYRRVF